MSVFLLYLIVGLLINIVVILCDDPDFKTKPEELPWPMLFWPILVVLMLAFGWCYRKKVSRR